MLGSLNTNFSVIGLTETWLHDDNQDHFSLKNYDFVNVNRKLKKGGGVGIYISQHLKYKTRNDLNATKEDIIESVFTEIPTKVSKNIIVGVIYRPPNSKFDEFERTLNETLSKIDKENKTCYLMGDFNVDMLKNETCDFANRLTQNLFTSFYFPLITMPTRITQHTATLIDNLFSNDLEKINYSQNGLISSDISNHLPIFHICGVNKENTKNRKKH
jgi:exonuclease III